MEENHYYPFGLQHGSYNTPARDYRPIGDAREIEMVNRNPYKYKYNSKEWQDELGLNWYDYGARNYDASLGRWMNVDPLVEQTGQAYIGMGNNPVNLIDPTGMAPEDWIEQTDNKGIKTYTFDASVTTIAEAEAAGYKIVTGVGETGFVNHPDGSYSFNLNIDGSVSTSDGRLFTSSFETELGTKVNAITPKGMATISSWDGHRGFWGNWSNSDNFLASLSYNLLNDSYVTLQGFDFDLIGKDYKNPLTGRRAATNMDGTLNYKMMDSFASTAATVIPVGRGAVLSKSGIGYISVRAQAYSPHFFSPLRGVYVNKTSEKIINYGIGQWNNQVSNGMILLKVKSLKTE